MLEEAGKVAQQLGALVALAEDLVSVPSAHRMAHIHLWLQFSGTRCLLTSASKHPVQALHVRVHSQDTHTNNMSI